MIDDSKAIDIAILRQKARAQLLDLEITLRELGPSLSVGQLVEQSAAVAELRRVLHGHGPAPVTAEVPANVRRLVAFGKQGPKFGASGGVEVAVGGAGLRMPSRDLIDIDAKYDSTPSTADAFAAAHDLPADGPEQTAVQNEERK